METAWAVSSKRANRFLPLCRKQTLTSFHRFPHRQYAFTSLETHITNFHTQIRSLSESASLPFPKVLLLFSGQTTFVTISRSRGRVVFCYINNCWQNSSFQNATFLWEGTPPNSLLFNQQVFVTVVTYPSSNGFEASRVDIKRLSSCKRICNQIS